MIFFGDSISYMSFNIDGSFRWKGDSYRCWKYCLAETEYNKDQIVIANNMNRKGRADMTLPFC